MGAIKPIIPILQYSIIPVPCGLRLLLKKLLDEQID
jgi:hypothetical protein